MLKVFDLKNPQRLDDAHKSHTDFSGIVRDTSDGPETLAYVRGDDYAKAVVEKLNEKYGTGGSYTLDLRLQDKAVNAYGQNISSGSFCAIGDTERCMILAYCRNDVVQFIIRAMVEIQPH